MKKLLLSISIIMLALIKISQAQHVTLLEMPGPGALGKRDPFNSADALYDLYQNPVSKKSQLVKITGTKMSLISNPDETGTVNELLNPILFNNELYFSYTYEDEVYKKTHFLAKYDGAKTLVIPNPDASSNESTGFSGGYNGRPAIFNQNLYSTYYSKITKKQYMYKYDGEKSEMIDLPNGYSIYSKYYVTYSKLYFVVVKSGIYQLASFDGTNFETFTNPDAGIGFSANDYFVHNDNLYGLYTSQENVSHLVKFNTSTNHIEIIPNPAGFSASGVAPAPFEGNLIGQYYNAALKKYQLGVFDGQVTSLVDNPDGGRGVNVHSSITFKGKLLIRYRGLEGKEYIGMYPNFENKIVLLDGFPEVTENITSMNPVVYKDMVYFSYYKPGYKAQLMKYDGANLIPIADNNNGSVSSEIFDLDGEIYFKYYDENGNLRLATTATPLPVKLIHYTAKSQNNVASIEWKTSSETNNSHFIIERSFDGKTFKTLSTIKAKGSETSSASYSFSDVNPVNGINYYRLSQVDKDGSTIVYDVKAVNFSISLPAQVLLYPNPAVSEVNISFKKGLYNKAELTDLGSKIITTLNIPSEAEWLNFKIAGLASGVYIIRLSGKENTAHKFIKR